MIGYPPSFLAALWECPPGRARVLLSRPCAGRRPLRRPAMRFGRRGELGARLFVFSCGNLHEVIVYEKNNGTFSFNFQSQRPRRGILGQRQQVVPGAGAQGQRQWHVCHSLRRISRKARPPGGSAAATDEEQCEGRRRCKPEQILDGKKRRTRKRRPWWDPAIVGEGVSSSSRSIVSCCPHFQSSNTRTSSPRSTSLRRVLGKHPASQSR